MYILPYLFRGKNTLLITEKGVKHLFLNTALGWRCENYDFLTLLPSIETLALVEEPEMSLKQIESLKTLRNLEITTPYCYDTAINLHINKNRNHLFMQIIAIMLGGAGGIRTLVQTRSQ